MQSRMEKRMRKKTKRRKRRLWIFTPILLLFTIVFIYGVHLATKIADVTNEAHQQLERGETSEKRVEPVYPGKDNFSVLFIGVDERDGETKSRSDVLILATFNKDDHSIKMLSIPRDSRVDIPGYYTTRINTAHFLGGVDLAVETVENFLDVPVDYYVKLNFDAFIEIIDALGGITVDVPFTFTEMDSEDHKNAITLHEGEQHLDGEEALAFVRMRKQDPLGDFGRNERQKQVIKAVIEKSATFSSVMKYDDILNSIGKNMTTNFTFQNIIALHPYAKSIQSIDSLKFEGQDAYIDGAYYFIINEDSRIEMSNMLKEHLGIENTTAAE
ncbi:LCP family protein [Fervidibacillus halotolerans]|uniref:LCP family protein n=1 Tax=Fervidibacillus halotolerans TaxID=2980027 RepID=A0A9E8LZV6_9BACI|nr:LCP family protein [Fervidibacillus halotolerans]WAA12041.1 LCP family protein [Fervidibacillus halotolerans]